MTSTPSSPRPAALILVLGDQLSPDIAALRAGDRSRDTVLMAEVAQEAAYVPHHKKKLAFVFAAMRHFAQELEEAGWQVRYVRLDDPDNTDTIPGELTRAMEACGTDHVHLTEPGEYRLKTALSDWAAHAKKTAGSQVEIHEDTRFIASHQMFRTWAEGRKQLRMEYLYREMRRKTGILMDGDAPMGGKWNFDAENRKPADTDLDMPRPLDHAPDPITAEVLDMVDSRFAKNFGTLRPFWFATTRAGAEAALDHFVAHALPDFGDYQDAMLEGERFLFHAVLSQYINVGLLDPLAVCQKAEQAYHDGHAPLNAVEGFIRQILGWREYMRGVYWLHMPGYTDRNALCATRPLPGFYWTGDTDMACMAAVIRQTRDEAYAHHIQRLMVTGNFAMLAGIDPHAVHEWYLAVYADAYEWVEAPNVIGMSQFADGGIVGSKPYAASGNYINKMSDHCAGCAYDVKQKTGPHACPFNPLYWDFLIRNRAHLSNNPRLGHAFRTWDRMDGLKQTAYRDSAQVILATLTGS